MPRTPQQIKEIVSGGKNRTKIKRAAEHQRRVGLHTRVDVIQTPHHKVPGSFLDFIASILPTEAKFRKFCALLRVPVPTVSLTDEIFSALEKVYDGRDPVIRREFTNESLEADYQEYWNTIGGGQKWRKQSAQAMRTAFNSLIVVDLPAEQVTERPEPYYYFLPVDRVVDFDEVDGVFNWVAFYGDDEKRTLAVYDVDEYAVYSLDAKTGMVGDVITANEHDLGYCPVQHFWQTSLNGDGFERRSPVSIQLGELDHLLKDVVFARHHKMYAGYPVWTGYKSNCNHQDIDREAYCHMGIMRDMNSNDGLVNPRTGGMVKCPKCSNPGEFAGPGTTILVDPPSGDNEMADLRNPAALIEPGVDLLKFNSEDNQQTAQRIFMAITGNSMESKDGQPINEKQVQSLFEAGTTALMTLKPNLEHPQNWLESTIARLRYGVDAIAEFVTNYGTQYYIVTAEMLLEAYHAAREKNASAYVLDTLEDQFIDTKYRHDSEMLERMRFLVNLEPCRHLSTDQAKELKDDGALSLIDYSIKANFSSLLARFERENGPVTTFGLALEFSARVRAVYESLKGYAMEVMPEVEAEPDPDGEGGDVDVSEEVKTKARVDAYGVAVRAGAITPQQADENSFRQALGLPPAGTEVSGDWSETGGVRKPITLQSETEPAPPGPPPEGENF